MAGARGRTQHFPWSELEAAASAMLGPHWTVDELAERIGMNWRSVRRWSATGRVPALRSDRVACRLGLHPMLVFSGWEAWADRAMGVTPDDMASAGSEHD